MGTRNRVCVAAEGARCRPPGRTNREATPSSVLLHAECPGHRAASRVRSLGGGSSSSLAQSTEVRPAVLPRRASRPGQAPGARNATFVRSDLADLSGHRDADRDQDEQDQQLLQDGVSLRADRVGRRIVVRSARARPRPEVNGVWWPPSSSKRVGRAIPVRWVRFLPPPRVISCGRRGRGSAGGRPAHPIRTRPQCRPGRRGGPGARGRRRSRAGRCPRSGTRAAA